MKRMTGVLGGEGRAAAEEEADSDPEFKRLRVNVAGKSAKIFKKVFY